MHRVMNYPGQIPLETDLLRTNRYAMVGLSMLAQDLIGTATQVGGFTCIPTAPASLSVQVTPGRIYSLQNLDSTAFSSLAADTTHQILKQGILLNAVTLACPAPTTTGFSVNYLIEAAYQDVDTDPVTLPYYNSANPAQAYSGPANSGAQQATTRAGIVNLVAKVGIAAATGTQVTPAPDAGFVGLFVVTVANGATTITSGNISTYASVPLINPLQPFNPLLNYVANTTNWGLLNDTVKVNWFASSAVAGNAIPQIQAALNWCALRPQGSGAIEFDGSPLTCSGAVSLLIDNNTTGVVGNGTTLNCQGMTVPLWTFKQSSTDPNLRQGLNSAHPFERLIMIGPGNATNAVHCIDAQDTTPLAGPSYWLSGITWRDCSFFNWYQDVVFGNGAFRWTFESCIFAITGGAGYDTSWLLTNANNGGENIQGIGCFFGKVQGTAIRNQNPNSSVYLTDCSGDYNACLIDAQGGYTEWDGYIESNTDSNYWIKVTGTNTMVRVAGELVLTGPKSAYEIFYSDPSCTNGGLDIDITREFAPVSYPLKLVAGSGRVRYRERGAGYATTHPAVGGATNLLRNGGFESAGLTDWVLTGATLPAISSTYAHTGTYSCKLLGAPGSTPAMVTSFGCKPGECLLGELYYRVDNITGTGATFYVTYSYTDASGTAITSSAALTVTTNVGAWTQCLFSAQNPAPAGTRSCSVTIEIYGVSTGAPAAYVDDIQIAVV